MKGSETKIAKRYARALFDLLDPSSVESVRDALRSFSDLWLESQDLRYAISDPAYAMPQRMEVVREISSHVGQNDERFVNFLMLLLKNSRMDLLPEVAVSFDRLVNELKSILSLSVVSAFPLSESEKGEIVSRIQSEFGSMASVSWEVDPALIGGLVIKSGDLVLDNSVKGALGKIKISLSM